MSTSSTISPHELKPGMIINADIICNGNLLLAKGTVVKPNYIDQLLAWGISTVSVLTDQSSDEEILKNPVQEFYAQTYKEVGAIIEMFRQEQPLNTSHIFPLVEKILETVFVNQNSMLLLTGFNNVSDYLHAHSLDVCVFSLITAKAMGLDYEEIVDLGIAALLHDIGKIKVSDAILSKPSSLTSEEYDEVKKHSKYGYDLVLKIPGFKRDVAQIIMQHHERCDGSGYPRGLNSDEISSLAKIIVVADIYDALTSDRVYNKKILPHEAAEYLLCISYSLIDPEITKVFLKNIAIYPPGCQVLLNTNQIAIVVDPNPNMPLRPSLKITTDNAGNPLHKPYHCELETHPNIFIKSIFN
jgi:HD-GYP domain-containing protein (c-di-GMP phosphodiesterase class II)